MPYIVKVELTEEDIENKALAIVVNTKGQAAAIVTGVKATHNTSAILSKPVEL